MSRSRRKQQRWWLPRSSFLCLVSLLGIVALVTVTVMPIAAAPVLPPWRIELPWTSRTATVTIGTTEVEAEIADTGELRGRGLGYRDGLKPGHGMIFIFDDTSPRSFWMKGMRFCLDIIWIENGEIVGAAENACPEPGTPDADLERYRSPEPVSYVLEMPAGWLDEHGYGAGTPFTIQIPGDDRES
jgi:uncharacterized protein